MSEPGPNPTLAAPLDDPAVLAAAARYRLVGPPPRGGGAVGGRVGRTAGSGLEFREHRRYLPGDDVRHLDWAAFARTDLPTVRVFREEVAREVAVWLDGSASMGCDLAKALLAKQLAAFCWRAAAADGDRPTLHVLSESERPTPRGVPAESLDVVRFDGRVALPDLLSRGALPPGGRGVRVVLSDFLFPHDAGALVRRLSRGADAATLIQILSPFEADPPAVGGRRLIDPEANESAEVTLDRHAVAAYRTRLRTLTDGLARACRACGVRFASVTAGPTLDGVCRDALAPAGALGVRG